LAKAKGAGISCEAIANLASKKNRQLKKNEFEGRGGSSENKLRARPRVKMNGVGNVGRGVKKGPMDMRKGMEAAIHTSGVETIQAWRGGGSA